MLGERRRFRVRHDLTADLEGASGLARLCQHGADREEALRVFRHQDAAVRLAAWRVSRNGRRCLLMSGMTGVRERRACHEQAG